MLLLLFEGGVCISARLVRSRGRHSIREASSLAGGARGVGLEACKMLGAGGHVGRARRPHDRVPVVVTDRVPVRSRLLGVKVADDALEDFGIVKLLANLLGLDLRLLIDDHLALRLARGQRLAPLRALQLGLAGVTLQAR